MKKTFRFFYILTIMSFILLPFTPIKKQSTILYAQAKSNKIKLNYSKLTLGVGQKTKLKLLNAKKKVNWRSYKKSIASVSKKGVVTAKRSGNTTIIATSCKKKYKCKITIYSNSSNQNDTDTDFTILDSQSEDYKANVTYISEDTPTHLVLVFKNANNSNAKIDYSVTYFDSNNTPISVSNDFFYISKQAEYVNSIPHPVDSNYHDLSYNHYSVTYSVDPTGNSNDERAYISHSETFSTKSVIMNCFNSYSKNIDAKIAIIFYKSNKIIGCDSKYITLPANGNMYFDFDFPTDNQYNGIAPDSYKIVINSARS